MKEFLVVKSYNQYETSVDYEKAESIEELEEKLVYPNGKDTKPDIHYEIIIIDVEHVHNVDFDAHNKAYKELKKKEKESGQKEKDEKEFQRLGHKLGKF